MEFTQLIQQNEAARIIAMEESRDRGRSINSQAHTLQAQNEIDRLRALNAELVAALRELLAVDERKLRSLEKRPYAIGLQTVQTRVEKARAVLAKVTP